MGLYVRGIIEFSNSAGRYSDGVQGGGQRAGRSISFTSCREPMRQNRCSYCASLALVGILRCSDLFACGYV